MQTTKITFSFGKNWNDFVRAYYSEERLREAIKSLEEITQSSSLSEKTFLDIGSGSGLFSLAAQKLGASSIQSMDVDPFSVSTTRYLRDHYGNADQWKILEGSVLDENWLRNHIHPADIVYSWGVLHHTGAMWQAIENAAALTKKGGSFIIAIYNKTNKLMGSRAWWHVKRIYNRMPRPLKYAMEILCVAKYVFLHVLRNPLKPIKAFKQQINAIKNYQTSRGMNYFTDVRDWLGGYPYEYATAEEIVSFVEKLGFTCKKNWPHGGTACNEFLFVKG